MSILREKISRDVKIGWEKEKEKIMSALSSMPEKNTLLDSDLISDFRVSFLINDFNFH